MPFVAPAEDYDRYMGRYTPSLAVALADAARVEPRMRVVDVGCGPGGLTAELAGRVGAENVAAIDPAPQFAQACRERHPGVDVRNGVAEDLPWDDASFDAALSSLVIGFMSDPDQGVREMARVTKPGGRVAACMWDIQTGGMTMLRIFWDAVRQIEPDVQGEHALPGTADGDILARFERAGLTELVAGTLTAHADYTGFDDFWEPFTFAIGPAGEHLRSLSPGQQAQVRDACRPLVPDGPFGLDARAWYTRGTVAAVHTAQAWT
jgi:SAM-dependent methyltransferase